MATTTDQGSQVARELIEALGLDPDATQCVVFYIPNDDILYADVECAPDEDCMKRILSVVKRHALHIGEQIAPTRTVDRPEAEDTDLDGNPATYNDDPRRVYPDHDGSIEAQLHREASQ